MSTTATAATGQGTPNPAAQTTADKAPVQGQAPAAPAPATAPAAAAAAATRAGSAAPAPQASAPAAPADGQNGASQPGTQAQDPAKPAAEAPKYELKLPEGSLIEAKTVEAFATLAKEKGIAPEQAQAFLEFQHRERAALQEAHLSYARKMGEEGVEKLKSDPEFGGTNFSQTCEDIKRATDKLFPELKTLVGDSPIGNAYELQLGLARIGKMMRAPAVPTNVKPPSTKLPSFAEAMYPHMMSGGK